MSPALKAFLDSLLQTVRENPVVVTQVAAAALSLAVALGFALPVGATAAVMAVAQLVAALVGRSQVVPLAKASAVTEDH